MLFLSPACRRLDGGPRELDLVGAVVEPVLALVLAPVLALALALALALVLALLLVLSTSTSI